MAEAEAEVVEQVVVAQMVPLAVEVEVL